MTMNDLPYYRHDSKNDNQIIFIRKTIHSLLIIIKHVLTSSSSPPLPPPPPPHQKLQYHKLQTAIGEENPEQLAARAHRLGLSPKGTFLICDIDVDSAGTEHCLFHTVYSILCVSRGACCCVYDIIQICFAFFVLSFRH
jgi:hypothetical protein